MPVTDKRKKFVEQLTPVALQHYRDLFARCTREHWCKEFLRDNLDLSSQEAENRWILAADKVYKFPMYSDLVGFASPQRCTHQHSITINGKRHSLVLPSASRLAELGLLGFFSWEGRFIFVDWWSRPKKSGHYHRWFITTKADFLPEDRLAPVIIPPKGRYPFLYESIYSFQDLSAFKNMLSFWYCEDEFSDTDFSEANNQFLLEHIASEVFHIFGRADITRLTRPDLQLEQTEFTPLANYLIREKRPRKNSFVRYIDGNLFNCSPNNLRWSQPVVQCSRCLEYSESDTTTVLKRNGRKARLCNGCIKTCAWWYDQYE
jgi:hypothetical protein